MVPLRLTRKRPFYVRVQDKPTHKVNSWHRSFSSIIGCPHSLSFVALLLSDCKCKAQEQENISCTGHESIIRPIALKKRGGLNKLNYSSFLCRESKNDLWNMTSENIMPEMVAKYSNK